jgi:hypothetical protein
MGPRSHTNAGRNRRLRALLPNGVAFAALSTLDMAANRRVTRPQPKPSHAEVRPHRADKPPGRKRCVTG